MSLETGYLPKSAIRLEAEVVSTAILERQAELNQMYVERQTETFANLRRKLRYDEPEELDDKPAKLDKKITDTRVKDMRPAVMAHALKEVLPPSRRSADTVINGRHNLENILDGQDDRLFVVVGPCSVHDPDEALEYADWLTDKRQAYGGELELVMRTYLEKPRSGLGWKGLVNDPNLNGKPNISLGLTLGRLLLREITHRGVPIALEPVDSRTTQYFDDAVVYNPMGARDSETNRARVFESVTSAVGGFKNPPDGDLLVAVQGVVTARAEHTYLGDGELGELAEIDSTGNETVHIIHRGGKNGPNFSAEHVAESKSLLQAYDLPLNISIDVSHGNSGKDPTQQINGISDICEQMSMGEKAIKGVMIESYLRAGRQDFEPGRPLEKGKSITDGCVDLKETDAMLQMLAGAVMMRRQNHYG